MSEVDRQGRSKLEGLLEAVERGEEGAFATLVETIYPDLKKLAHFHLTRERPDHSLNTTAIVHEAFLRLAGSNGTYSDRAHFLRAAATVMRHLLVDYARSRNAEKRGSGVKPMTFCDDQLVTEDDTLAVLAMDAAIKDIAEIDPQLEQIIECRFFAGLTVRETAEALGRPVRSIERDWRKAKGYVSTALETSDE